MNALLRTLCVGLVLSVAMPVLAQDGSTNRVSGLQITEQEDHTEIRISGDANPTYSVYQLRNPLRLFVDIAQSELATDASTVEVDNGVVDQVGITSFEDELASVTRVVVGFDQNALYDVDVVDNTVVVRIDGAQRNVFVGREPSSEEDFEVLRNELAASAERIAAMESAVADAEQRASAAQAGMLEAQLERENAERARLTALADRHHLESDYQAIASSHGEALVQLSMLEGELQARDGQLASQEARLAELEAQRSEALDRIAALQRQLEDQRVELNDRDAAVSALERTLSEREAQGADADELAALREELAERTEEATALRDRNVEAEQQLQLALAEARDAQQAQRVAAAAQNAAPVIQDIRFESVDGVDRVVITVPSSADFTTLPGDGARSAMTLPGSQLPDALRRTLDTQAYDGPIEFVSSYTDADGQVRVVVELGQPAAEMIRREGETIVWEFAAVSAPDAGVATSAAPTQAAHSTPVTSQSSSPSPFALASGGGSSTSAGARPQMTRKRITIDLRNADIQNVLRLIADEGNINIVANEDVTGSITLRLRSVPLDEALAVILRSQNLGWAQDGNIIRVAPASVFQDEYERQLQYVEDAWRLEPLRVRMIPVNYAEVSQISGLVFGVLTSRGNLSVDIRNNTLIITDIISQLDMVQELVQRLDTQTPQVLIEARIVETNDQFRRQLGIQWGGDFLADQAIGNSTGLLFPSTIGIAGGADDGQASNAGSSSAPNWAVNLPAPAGTGSGGALGFTFGSLSGAFNLNVRLSAAEDMGSAKVISAPRILTMHNETASITSGVSIPVSVVSAAGAQTVFFDASLQLVVRPRVTPDGYIFLTVNISKNEPDFENTGSRGDPSIIRREANTQLLVRDGDTSVIGGIFSRNTGFSQSQVPFFGRIPVLGPLFRNSSQTDVRNELLVFITPRIVNRDVSIDRIGAGGDFDTSSPETRGGFSGGGGGQGVQNRNNRQQRRNRNRR